MGRVRRNSHTTVEPWEGWGFMGGCGIRRVLLKEQSSKDTLGILVDSFQTPQAVERNILK